MTQPPTGTITFLFTDIEKSTHLWETHPEAMNDALARHDELLRGAIEAHNGYIFRTVGDAFCAAFISAPDAIDAALAVQRALTAETWPDEVGELRVRIGLHTGSAIIRDGDYHGRSLNRVARLEAAGHGGQILISQVTQDLIWDDLPEGVSLVDLGSHRLKDLLRSEHIYQITANDLTADFPPLRTLDRDLHNLPSQPTLLIGRERELTAILNLLQRADVRLATLTGPGGTGKTRLSQQVAADLIDDYEHGVWFVDLSCIFDPMLVATMINAALGIREGEGQSAKDVLKAFIKDRQLLLVLDNFEQIMDASRLVASLLRDAPDLKVLVTSREVLRIRGEHVYPVPPLGLPENGDRHQTAATIAQYEAVRLFTDRAQAANPSFDVTEDNAPDVVHICHRLDGLPLALELAAARLRMMTPAAIVAQLENRLKTIRGGARDLPHRQQTIRGAIDWSYDLLSDEEKDVFARLGIFAGGWSFEAAEAVCGDEVDVFGVMESLLDKSLIRQSAPLLDASRFNMLETIREYAREKLQESGNLNDVARPHAAYFKTYGPHLQDKTLVERSLSLEDTRHIIDREMFNLRAAINWSLELDPDTGHLRDIDTLVQIVGSMIAYWFNNGDPREIKSAIEHALDYLPENVQGTFAHGTLLSSNAMLIGVVGGDTGLARRQIEHAITIWRVLDNKAELVSALNTLGRIAISQNDNDVALDALSEARDLARQMGKMFDAVMATVSLGNVAMEIGDYEAAEGYLREVQQAVRPVLDTDPTALAAYHVAIDNLGEVARCLGKYAEAKDHYEKVREPYRTSGMGDLPRVQHNLGYVALAEEDFDEAESLFRESLTGFQERNKPRGIWECLNGFGCLAVDRGDTVAGVTLLAAAEAAFENMHTQPWPSDRLEIARRWETANAALSEDAINEARERGRSLLLDQVIALALADSN